MAILKELRRYSSQKSIRGLSHSSTSRPFSTRSKIKLTGARANRVTHRRSQGADQTSARFSCFIYYPTSYKENIFLITGVLGIISAKRRHQIILTKKVVISLSTENNMTAILFEIPVYNSNI